MNKRYLQAIKERYRYKNGSLVHDGDCKINRTGYPHCSCGLIHDLMILPHASRIFPKYGEHRGISDGVGTMYPKPTEKEIEEGWKLVEEALGPPRALPPEEAEIYEQEEQFTEWFFKEGNRDKLPFDKIPWDLPEGSIIQSDRLTESFDDIFQSQLEQLPFSLSLNDFSLVVDIRNNCFRVMASGPCCWPGVPYEEKRYSPEERDKVIMDIEGWVRRYVNKDKEQNNE